MKHKENSDVGSQGQDWNSLAGETSGDLRKTSRHDLPMCCGNGKVGDWVRIVRKSLGVTSSGILIGVCPCHPPFSIVVLVVSVLIIVLISALLL